MKFLCTILALLLLSCSSPVEWKDPAITGEPFRKEWGIHQIQNGTGAFTDGIEEQLAELGAGCTFVATFTDLPNPIPAAIIAEAHTYGLTPVISFEPSKTWGDNKQNELVGILNGYWDSTLTAWATSLAALEDSVILRFGYEMNGDWFAYGQNPDSFVQAWHHTHKIFEEAGAQNVSWMFSPNVEWDGGGGLKSIEQYYPGDGVVDLLGLDGYNFGDNHDKWHWWQSYSYVFEASIEKMSRFDKPLYLAEIGCADDERQSLWLEDFLTRMSYDSRLSGFLYFNQHTTWKDEPDWCLTCDSSSLKVFQHWSEANTLLPFQP